MALKKTPILNIFEYGLYAHMAKRHDGIECTQDGYPLQGHHKCRSLVKRLNIKYISERNESKTKILRKFPLYSFLNPLIKFDPHIIPAQQIDF